MKNIFKRFFRSKSVNRIQLENELNEFMHFLHSPTVKVDQNVLGSKLRSFTKLSTDEKVKQLPAVYLYVEQAHCSQYKQQLTAKQQLRESLKERFPNLSESKYLGIIYLHYSKQEQKLAYFLVEHIWDKATNIIGGTKGNIINDHHQKVIANFRKFRNNHISKDELQTYIKSEVSALLNYLSLYLGENKVKSLFQDSYNFLSANYKFLDTFSFLISLFPDSYLNEHQLSLLSRMQLEKVLQERSEKLERANHRLKEEILNKEKAQKELRSNSQRIQQIIENAMDAVILTDSEGKIVYWNQQAEVQFGWNAIEVEGLSMSELLFPEENRDAFELELSNYIITGNSSFLNKRFEQVGITKSGQQITLELSIIAYRTEDDIIFTSFIRDITNRKKFEQQLLDDKNNAQKASDAKANFLSTMSHEIRTPMNALYGTIELLLLENPREDQIDSLELMKHSTENLLVILNDVLDFSKIEEGYVEFDKRTFSLQELCKRIIATYTQKAEEKGIALILESEYQMPDQLLGDPVRLSQILNNLISNAIKFTFEGSVELQIELSDESEDTITVLFKVIDSGVGIPAEEHERIFNRFTQIKNPKSSNTHSGTGLGLAIAKKLLLLQKSDLFLESEVGYGSCFFFELTLEKDKVTSNIITEKQQVVKDLSGLKILLVEDNKINQIIASKFLNKWNCHVTYVDNGEEATEVIGSKNFDIILMDLQMPLLNGYETTIAIRNMDGPYFKQIPIIAITADALPEVKKKTKDVGMNDLMTKPFHPETLYFTIVSNLNYYRISS